MDAGDIGLRAVGAFYMFGGWLAARAAMTSYVVDQALAGIAGKTGPRAETARTIWLAVSSVLVFAGGAALLVLIDAAAPLFVASALGQAAYLTVVAPRWLDPADPPDRLGRRQTTNAFVVYLAATALVLWAGYTGKLIGWRDAHWLVPAAVAASTGVLALYVARLLLVPWPGGTDAASASDGQPDDDIHDDDDDILNGLTGILVKAEHHRFPLQAYQPGKYGDIAPDTLHLSPQLTSDLNDWGEAISASVPEDHAAPSPWSEAEFAAHAARARPLASRLARERPDLTIYIEIPEAGIEEVHVHEAEQRGGAY